MAQIPPRLSGINIAILSATGMHEHEFWVPYYRFIEEGANVIVCGFEKNLVYQGEGRNGRDGIDLAPVDMSVDEVNPDTLDALVIPGGIYGPLALRSNEAVLNLVVTMNKQNKIIAAICHAPWVLISAEILEGRKCASPSEIAIDLANAGCESIKEGAIRDGNLITAEYFDYLPQFLRLIIDALEG